MSGLGNMPVWLNGLFASPWMLLWLPAVVAPLVIHLLYRQRYREISWAAMEYLLAAIEKSARRMRIQQWLLLLVRMLLLLLILLAMAEPLVRNLSPLSLSEGSTHHIFLLDGSYSMGYRAESETDFERAKAQIVERVEAGQGGDGYSLIMMGKQPEIVVGPPSYDAQKFVAELDGLPIGQAGADLDSALESAQKLIESTDEKGAFSRHVITILSDLGRTTWGPDSQGDAGGVQRGAQLAQLTNGGSIEVVAIESVNGNRQNTAIVDLAVSGPITTIAAPTRLVATLHPFTTQPLQEQTVELWVDGIRVEQKKVDLPEDTDTQVVFMHTFVDPGAHAVSVRLAGDQLPIDNQRDLALNVKEKINILLVRGKQGATLPLLAAMNAADQKVNATKVEVVDESRLAEIDLNHYDCIFLCNVAQWTLQEASRLNNYVTQGGGLVTILGDQVLTERYNRNVYNEANRPKNPQVREQQAGFLPAKVRQVFYDGEYHFPNPKDYTHPILAPWKGNPRTGLTSVPVLQYFQLEVPEGSGANAILWLDTGDPLLVLSRIGNGWSLLVATDPTESSRAANNSERSWSLIASWLNAQPFFDGLWKAVVGGRLSGSNLEVGQWLHGKLVGLTGSQSVVLEIPDNPPQNEKIAIRLDGSWSYGRAEKSGVYRLQVENDSQSDLQSEEASKAIVANDRVYAVNLDTRESNLDSLSLGELAPEWRKQTLEQSMRAVGSSQAPVGPSAGAIFLWLVLLLLFLEIFLAWWIGNRFA